MKTYFHVFPARFSKQSPFSLCTPSLPSGVSLPALSVLFPSQQEASARFNFILALAFPVSSSSSSVFHPKLQSHPLSRYSPCPLVACSSPVALSIRIGSCACLGEEALARQGTRFLFDFFSEEEMVLEGKSSTSSGRATWGLVQLWSVGKLHEPLEHSQ